MNNNFLFLMGDGLYTYGPWVQFILFIIMCILMKNKFVLRIKLLRSQLWAVNNLKASNIRDILINIIINSLNIITRVLSTTFKWCLILIFFHTISCLAISWDMLLEWILHSYNKFRGKFLSYFIIVLFKPW
jgi:hypothetical protein